MQTPPWQSHRPTLRTMQIWFTATAVLVFTVLALVAALAFMARHRNLKNRQGFARKPTLATTAPTLPTPLTRKKPEWMMLEVLRLKAA